MKKLEIKKDILNGNISQQILLITVPICGTYLLQQLYQFVDFIVLGRYAGVEAMAAVGGSASMILNNLVNIVIGLATGLMVLVAQSYGRHNSERVTETVKTGMFIAIVFGGIISLLVAFFSKPLLVLMNCPTEIIRPSLIYMYLYLAGVIPYAIYTFGMYVLRATGDTKISGFFTIIIAVVKIVLDILLTAILKIGVWGVAISTFASYLVCGIVVLIILNKTYDSYHYSLKNFGFDLNIMKEIFRVGIPIAIQSTVFTITNALMSVKINVYGTNVVAAFTAYNNVDNFFWSFSNAIGCAILTIVGQNYGNKNMERVKETFKKGIIIHTIVTIIITVLVIKFGYQLLTLFTTDKQVLDIAYKALSTYAKAYFSYILIEIVSATIKGCGDATNSMIIAIIGICVVRIAYLELYPLNSLNNVLACYPLSWSISSVIFLIYFLINKKYKSTKNN